MEFNAYSMLVDFMWAGISCLWQKMLREKIKILQSLFVPVSLLAGFIGLAVRTEWFWNYQFFFTVWFLCRSADYCSICIIGLRGFNFQLVAENKF